jgi:hypothetical protein
MKTWIPSLLFSSRPFKEFEDFTEFIKENEIQVIVDLRERDPWYRKKNLQTKDGEDVEIIHLYIKPGETILDVGRNIKDKHATMKKFCQKIVIDFLLTKKLPTLIICNDGFQTAGYIALVCRFWYYLQKGDLKEEDFIKENAKTDFRSCKSKYQIEQAKAIAEHARGIVRWNGFSGK